MWIEDINLMENKVQFVWKKFAETRIILHPCNLLISTIFLATQLKV